jgi:hypothetical protein
MQPCNKTEAEHRPLLFWMGHTHTKGWVAERLKE